MKYTPYKIPTQPKTPDPVVISSFGGIDKSTTDTEIDLRHSPGMKNMIYDDDGILNKWPGYKRIFATALGTGSVNGLFFSSIRNKFIMAYGTKLYTLLDDGNQPVELYSGISDHKVRSFEMGGKQYFLDGTHYLVDNGTSVQAVSAVAYVPTLTMGRGTGGGGTAFEQFNMLTPYFIDSFSVVDNSGVALTYPMSLTGLDATPLVASWDKGLTWDKVETTHFTVDRTTGVVTFLTAPPVGTDILKIKAAKTVAGMADKINQCTFTGLFGGPNDTHVFFSGNPTYKNTDWNSAVLDPSYVPENRWTNIGSNTEAITGYSIQYDTQIVHKENSKWNRQFELVNGVANYPVKNVNADRGLIATDSLALIDNAPIGVDRKGVNTIVGGSVRDERNVYHKSRAVDTDLLKETLSGAIAIDYNFKYWLVLPSGNCYVCDYRHVYTDRNGELQYEWFELDNVPAKCFCEHNGYLYFGGNGLVYRMLKYSDTDRYQSDGAAITAIWIQKKESFGTNMFYKYINLEHISIKPEPKSEADVYYKTDEIYSDIMGTVNMSQFDFNNFDFNNLSFIVSDFPQTGTVDIKENGVSYFQNILKNDKLYYGMGIQRIEIEYEIRGRRK